MTAEFLRQMAQRCRDLVGRAQSEAARHQLRIWEVEFEAQADDAERDRNVGNVEELRNEDA